MILTTKLKCKHEFAAFQFSIIPVPHFASSVFHFYCFFRIWQIIRKTWHKTSNDVGYLHAYLKWFLGTNTNTVKKWGTKTGEYIQSHPIHFYFLSIGFLLLFLFFVFSLNSFSSVTSSLPQRSLNLLHDFIQQIKFSHSFLQKKYPTISFGVAKSHWHFFPLAMCCNLFVEHISHSESNK